MSKARFFGQVLAFASVTVLVSASQGQTTRYVDGDNACPGTGTQEDPFCAIQPCIGASVNGDTCLVVDGTYTGPLNRNLNFGGRLITLRSVNGSGACVIDCQGAGRGFIFLTGETVQAVVDGFTVRNGSSSSTGAGIDISNNSNPTITNCRFTANNAPFGSGMYNTGSSPTVTNCTFSDNAATTLAGGMFNDNASSPTVTNCTFRENSSGALGGGMINTINSNATVTNCMFSGNTAPLGGGMLNDNSSSPTVTNCTFRGNTADSGGGILNNHNSDPTVSTSILWDNTPSQITDVNGSGSVTTVTYSDVQGGWAGTGNINANPLFAVGRLGCNSLSQTAAGQAENSPCVNTGDPTSPIVDGTTRSDEVPDTGVADMGYHYPITGLVPGAPGVSADACIYDGFIDARRESADGATLIGLERVTFCFPTPMENDDGTPLDASAFSITDTAGTPPSITGVEIDLPAVTINLSGPITLQEWTTISVSAQSQCDQAPFEGSIDIGYLPADVDQSGCVNPLDLLTFKQYVNDITTPPVGVIEDFIDTNRSGDVNPLDLLAFKQLINGIAPPATQEWASRCLPAQP